MSEFDGYLRELRSHLSDLDPKRADEILAELRGHLESRVKQFEATGLNREEAVEATVRSFGDPAALSTRLMRANARHRRLTPLRAVAAPALVGGAMIALVGSDTLWDRGYSTWLADSTPLIRAEADLLLLTVALTPAAVLGGMIAGRRWWWLAGLPPFLWGLLFWVISLAQFSMLSHGTPRATFAALVSWPIGGGALLAACGLVGARLGEVASLRRTVAWVCAVVAAAVMLVGLVTSASDAIGVWAAIASIEAAGGLIGLTALFSSRRARRQTLVVAAVLWALCVIAVIQTARDPNYGRYVANWIGLALVQAVFAAGVYWHYRSSGAAVRRPAAKRRGFTLMELMVVVAIIGILVAITLPVYARSRAKAREAVCISNLKQLVTAMQMYAADYDGGLLPNPYGRVPGCTPRTDDDGHGAVLDAIDLYLLGGYAPYGATVETWHCPDQPWPATPEDGRALIRGLQQQGELTPAGIENPHYRTYYYTWLPRLEKKKHQMYKGRPETAYWVDYVVADSWLIGFHLYVPDGMGGWREYPVGPHGDVKRLHHSRVCVGYLDGHVESVREGDLRWRHFPENEP